MPDVIAFFKEYETKIVVYAQDAPDTVRSNFESELKKIFGPDWRNEKRLSHTACERLLAAKILMYYSSKTCLEDYRGIIIAASSALEYELARRFFDLQLAYLRENGYREEEYPNCFHLDSYPNKPLGFTLGSLFSIIKTSEGNTKVNKTMTSFLWEKILSENAKRINIEKGFKNVGEVFINYNLDYPEASHAPISSTFSGKCTILAKDYRNKAAHKDIVDKSLADACCNMIGIGSNNIGYVDAASTLQHVQGLLKVLLLLTKPLDVEER